MNKKKTILISIVVLMIIASFLYLIQYLILVEKVASLNNGFKDCKKKFYEVQDYYLAERCFAKIINESGRIDYKYYHALALFNLMEFNKAKKELKEIIDNSNIISNKNLISKAKNMYDFLNSASEKELIYFIKYNDVEISEENSIKHDFGNYFSDLTKVAVWQNPKKITVYIGKSAKSETIKKAFEKWDEALGTLINFEFITEKQNADITCFGVKKLNETKLGSTKTFYKFDEKTGKRYLSKAKIQIVLYEPDTNKKIDDKNIFSTTLHEIGHAIGIISHSKHIGDIMYFDSSSYKQEKSEVSNRDINTVKKIYGDI